MKAISVIEDQDAIKKILKHLGLWGVKPRPPPRMAKTQSFHTEPHIDYSESQVPPSDNGSPYHVRGRFMWPRNIRRISLSEIETDMRHAG